MNRVHTLVAASLVIVVGGGVALAQQAQVPPRLDLPIAEQNAAPAPENELTEAEKESVDLVTGKGGLTWEEIVARWMEPRPIPKAAVVRIEGDDKYAYPHVAIGFKMEIVREEGDVVWMKGIDPGHPESALHKLWLQREVDQAYLKRQLEWEREHGVDTYILDFQEPIVPSPFQDSLELERVKSSLPASGSWQMSFALADMNADGELDLVLPPSRKGTPYPAILLGAGDGTFVFWSDTKWSLDVPFDYGGLRAADFDGDGHMDLVIGIHFRGQYVLYGDGAGDFQRSELLPSPDPRLTSRAPAVADFDGDGRLDVAFLAEVDYDLTTNARLEGAATVWVVFNWPEGWSSQGGKVAGLVIGDNLEAADMDRDGRVDLLVAANSTDFRDLVLYNREDGWTEGNHRGVLSAALHTDLAAPSSKPGEPVDLYAAFLQFRMVAGENRGRTGVMQYRVGPEGFAAPGKPIFLDEQRFNSVFRLGAGDLDGNGLADVVIGRKSGGLEVYLQVPGGEFYREASPELDDMMATPYDIQLVDLDGDGRDDVIFMSADREKIPGGVRVWLSRPRS